MKKEFNTEKEAIKYALRRGGDIYREGNKFIVDDGRMLASTIVLGILCIVAIIWIIATS